MGQRNTMSFEELAIWQKNRFLVDKKIFEVLSDPKSNNRQISDADKALRSKVEAILNEICSKDHLIGQNSAEEYHDCCINLTAYLLRFPNDKSIPMILESIERMLEFLESSQKTKLREFKQTFCHKNAFIENLNFDWKTLLMDRLSSSDIVSLFCNITIGKKSEPKVVEKIVEKTVEKTVYVTIKSTAPSPQPSKIDIKRFFGHEDSHTEFKSSFVFSPEGSSCNDQCFNVCKAVCAFLNNSGGDIFIGVNDGGYAYPQKEGEHYAGIAADISYLSRTNRAGFAINTVDHYCLYVKRAISERFAKYNSNVSLFKKNISVEPTENGNVIRIKITPSEYCVVHLDGAAYVRDGASSRKMDKTELFLREQQLRDIKNEARFYDVINKAIDEKKQLTLYKYSSVNSNTISDRHIEPISFVCGKTSVISYDLDKKDIRQFKLSRIGDVEISSRGWLYENEHIKARTDLFGWTECDNSYRICLDMEMAAMICLKESFPNVKDQKLEPLPNGQWRLDTNVYSLKPVCSFYLGHASEVIIRDTEDSPTLKKLITDFIFENVDFIKII